MTTLQGYLDPAAHADRIAITSSTHSLAYRQLDERSGRLAAFLRGHGLTERANAGVVMRESPEYPVALLAIWKAGAAAAPVNPLARPRELEKVFSFVEARVVLCDAGQARETLAKSSIDAAVIGIDDDGVRLGEQVIGWEDLPSPISGAEVDGSSIAMLMHTSGTTSAPKTVMLSHENLVSNLRSIVSYLQLDLDDRTLCVLPFHYVYGNSVLLTHLATGARVFLGSAMSFPQRVVDEMERYAITGFSGVQLTYHTLLNNTDWAQRRFETLRYLTQAGGPMPTSQVEFLLGLTRAPVSFFAMYGQTEASARLTYLPPGKLHEKRGSVGIPVPGVELSIQDEQGTPLPAGTDGEVCARGPNIMQGYWKNESATRHALRGGWLHTGDLGHLSADGYLYLTSRTSDMIKTGGHRVSPYEIEEVISEVAPHLIFAVVGLADDVLGQRISIVAEGEEDAAIKRQVMRYCKESLAPHKMPRAFIWIPKLPRTSGGKIRREALRKMETHNATGT
ncbi:MAG: acyl--CoA ligase [Pseudomonadales bacterium]|nr:acyl--CoA ligase [Pseudomonadales bacterium]